MQHAHAPRSSGSVRRAVQPDLLIRDAKEFAVYFDRHASSYPMYRDERVKRSPDPARLEELVTPLGHLHFMMIENRALAHEVMRLSEGT